MGKKKDDTRADELLLTVFVCVDVGDAMVYARSSGGPRPTYQRAAELEASTLTTASALALSTEARKVGSAGGRGFSQLLDGKLSGVVPPGQLSSFQSSLRS